MILINSLSQGTNKSAHTILEYLYKINNKSFLFTFVYSITYNMLVNIIRQLYRTESLFTRNEALFQCAGTEPITFPCLYVRFLSCCIHATEFINLTIKL